MPFLAVLANLLITSFCATSADSATWVISSFSTRGSRTADKRLTMFWGLTRGAVAAVLVYAGELKALQTASIVGSFPLVFIMFLLVKQGRPAPACAACRRFLLLHAVQAVPLTAGLEGTQTGG